MKNFKYHSTDNGFCRVYYTFKNIRNQNLIYCFQENHYNLIELLRCSKDGEPSHPIVFDETKYGLREENFETYIPESKIDFKVLDWIKNECP